MKLNGLRFLKRALLPILLCAVANAWAAAPLIVGTAANYKPVVYLKDNTVVGMEADFARLLSAQLGRPVQFKVMPDEALLSALQKGDIDLVMSGWRITPERQQQAEFANGYVTTGLMAIIRTEDVVRFHNPAALLRGGYKLAVIGGPGSVSAAYAKANFANVTEVPVADAEAGLQALLDKRADVLVDDAATSWNIATDKRYGALMSLGRLLTEEQLAWAVKKDNTALRGQLDRALQTLRQTGMVEHVYNRWIPMQSVSGNE